MKSSNRAAFSMIELVFAIVVLGIVASIGSEIIFKIYGQYITQRAQHRSSVKTQLALNQIANRIRYAIPGSLVRRDAKVGGTIEGLGQSMNLNSDDYTIFQWVGADGDSFETISSSASTGDGRRPGWSGFADIQNSTATDIITPGSNLDLIDPIIKNLGGDGINNAVIYFAGDDNSTAYGISSVSGNTITMDNAVPRISERYKLAWTSYALSVENGDLFLYYNFSPVIGTDITGANLRRELLLRNIENFKFREEGGVTRIKICIRERIGDAEFVPSCKEKAIF